MHVTGHADATLRRSSNTRMPAGILGVAAGLLLSLATVGQETPACGDDPATLERWRTVRAAPDTADADALAPQLAACLASPNPELRDRIGYEVLTYWLRQRAVSPETVAALRRQLQPWLGRREPEWAFGRAFAALMLSELVRFDTIERTWEEGERASLLADALAMLAAERDFRGLDPEVGWIHTVAHGSDLLWRLARHPATDPDALRAVLGGIAGKVAPPGDHAYTFNEPDRLARVVVAVATRQTVPGAELDRWLADFMVPRHMADWGDAFATPAGMAELHNTKHFLRALREGLRRGGLEDRLPAVDAVLAELP